MAILQQPRQTQRMAISPALWLGLNLLALPVDALKDAVKKEIESNPALERDPNAAFRGGQGAFASVDASDYLENVAADSAETLDEHLMGELRMGGVSGRELELCRAIVSELDSDGRFVGSIPDLMMVTQAGEKELEQARQRVMRIDPKGCGARDLAECYAAQIDDVPAAARPMFRQELTTLMSGKVSPAMVRIIKKLNPFPGRLYDHRKVEFVTPDIRVDSEGFVEVDTRDIPELRVSPKYVEMAKDPSQADDVRNYAAERVKRAREFRAALVRRQEVFGRIAEVAIAGQPEFLANGPMRRQTMSEVARQAKCSVATVSRAAARKYVKTPRGTVPFSRFFALVDQEPLDRLRGFLADMPEATDAEIAARMASAGYPMARRTVNKYRRKLLNNDIRA